MTAAEAARIIGCTARHVRTLIGTGKLPARRRFCRDGYGYTWSIRSADAKAYRDNQSKRGWPRGKPRRLPEEPTLP